MNWIGTGAVIAAVMIAVINVGRILYYRRKLKAESKCDHIYAEIAKSIELRQTVLERRFQEKIGREQADRAVARNQRNE